MQLGEILSRLILGNPQAWLLLFGSHVLGAVFCCRFLIGANPAIWRLVLIGVLLAGVEISFNLSFTGALMPSMSAILPPVYCGLAIFFCKLLMQAITLSSIIKIYLVTLGFGIVLGDTYILFW